MFLAFHVFVIVAATAHFAAVALASAGLLLIFALAMALSLGIKSPLDYSVFSASAAALLLATGDETVHP